MVATDVARKDEQPKMTKYAIITDRTPSRCTVVDLVESEGSALDVANERNVQLSGVMQVRDGSEVAVGDRAWHQDETVQ